MLVLTRRNQESVVVGRPSGIKKMLKVTVLEIKGGSVRLGFEADNDCPIRRWEVWEQICAFGRTDHQNAMSLESADE